MTAALLAVREGEPGESEVRRVVRYPDSHQVFVGNVPHDVDKAELKEFFERTSFLWGFFILYFFIFIFIFIFWVMPENNVTRSGVNASRAVNKCINERRVPFFLFVN